MNAWRHSRSVYEQLSKTVTILAKTTEDQWRIARRPPIRIPRQIEAEAVFPQFQTALGLQIEVLQRRFLPFLEFLNFASDDDWYYSLPGSPNPDDVAAVLGGNLENDQTALYYAGFFELLDHMAAFQDLFASNEHGEVLSRDFASLENEIGKILRWRLDFYFPHVYQRFVEMVDWTRELVASELNYIEASGEEGGAAFKARALELMDDWRRRAEGPQTPTPRTPPRRSGPVTGFTSGTPRPRPTVTA